jgi:hypothetical protein
MPSLTSINSTSRLLSSRVYDRYAVDDAELGTMHRKHENADRRREAIRCLCRPRTFIWAQLIATMRTIGVHLNELSEPPACGGSRLLIFLSKQASRHSGYVWD